MKRPRQLRVCVWILILSAMHADFLSAGNLNRAAAAGVQSPEAAPTPTPISRCQRSGSGPSLSNGTAQAPASISAAMSPAAGNPSTSRMKSARRDCDRMSKSVSPIAAAPMINGVRPAAGVWYTTDMLRLTAHSVSGARRVCAAGIGGDQAQVVPDH